MFYNEKHWKSNISFPPMVPIGSWEELWFPRVINRCSPTPPPALHLLHSAHHIDSIYNDSRQLEWVGVFGTKKMQKVCSRRALLCQTRQCNPSGNNSFIATPPLNILHMVQHTWTPDFFYKTVCDKVKGFHVVLLPRWGWGVGVGGVGGGGQFYSSLWTMD